MSRLKAATGASAAVGGAMMVSACFELASLPEGCVADECLTRPQRDWSDLASSLVFFGFVLMAASGLGMLVLALRASSGRRRRPVRAAGVVGAAGVGLLVAGVVFAGMGVPGMDNAMPFFVIGGLGLCVLGVVLTAWLVVQARVLPLWFGAVLGIAAAMALGANEQKDSVLLAAPLGAAWALAGVLLLLDAAHAGRSEVVEASASQG